MMMDSWWIHGDRLMIIDDDRWSDNLSQLLWRILILLEKKSTRRQLTLGATGSKLSIGIVSCLTSYDPRARFAILSDPNCHRSVTRFQIPTRRKLQFAPCLLRRIIAVLGAGTACGSIPQGQEDLRRTRGSLGGSWWSAQCEKWLVDGALIRRGLATHQNTKFILIQLTQSGLHDAHFLGDKNWIESTSCQLAMFWIKALECYSMCKDWQLCCQGLRKARLLEVQKRLQCMALRFLNMWSSWNSLSKCSISWYGKPFLLASHPVLSDDDARRVLRAKLGEGVRMVGTPNTSHVCATCKWRN